jgi:hypothetical protein
LRTSHVGTFHPTRFPVFQALSLYGRAAEKEGGGRREKENGKTRSTVVPYHQQVPTELFSILMMIYFLIFLILPKKNKKHYPHQIHWLPSAEQRTNHKLFICDSIIQP